MGTVPPARLEGVICLADGRVVGFAEYGDPRGRPVLWFHGTPGARRQVPPAARAMAEADGVRILSLERPGVGASTPHLYPSLVRWTDDVEQCLDRFGIERFSIFGLSGGGPYALACAHRWPTRVVSTATVGSVAPTTGDDAAEGGLTALAARLQPLLGVAREPLGLALWLTLNGLRPLASPVFDLYARVSPPGDRLVFGTPGMKDMFTDDLIRGGRRHFKAVVYDVVQFGRPWGFSPRDIAVPVHLWHGEDDNIVPIAHGEHLASLVPGSVLRRQPGQSHLGNLQAAHEVLEVLMADWAVGPRSEPPDGDEDRRTEAPRPVA